MSSRKDRQLRACKLVDADRQFANSIFNEAAAWPLTDTSDARGSLKAAKSVCARPGRRKKECASSMRDEGQPGVRQDHGGRSGRVEVGGSPCLLVRHPCEFVCGVGQCQAHLYDVRVTLLAAMIMIDDPA